MREFEDELSDEQRLISNVCSGDVLVLGAGFSKAVSSEFPVTDDLGHRALAAAGLDSQNVFTGGSFEAWLSYLAEPQPFLSHAENLDNGALFARLVDAIHDVLCAIERDAVGAGFPAWLYRLVAALHARRATVVTFNYDRILERALGELSLDDFPKRKGERRVRWSDPLDQVPPFPPAPARLAGARRPTFRLCKLHGSLNWFWVPGDVSGATLHHWELDDDPVERSRYLPGREPYLVPPASGKSAFFANPVMSETWRRAHEALSTAGRVCFVGYSLPLTDLTSAGMVSATLSRDDVALEVINVDPDPVIGSVARLTGRSAASNRNVEHFVDEYVKGAAEAMAVLCRTATDFPSDARVVVGWNHDQYGRATGVTRSDGTVEVHVHEFDGHATGVQHDSDNEVLESSMGTRMSELVALLQPGDSLEATFANGEQSPLVGIDCFHTSTGASTNWQVLMPADHPSSVGMGEIDA